MSKDRYRFPRTRHSALVFSSIGMAACGTMDVEGAADPTPASIEQPLLVVPGADLRIMPFEQTTQTFVDAFQQFSVTVKNQGSADSNPTTLTLTLLRTQTSPETFLLGSLQALPSGCSLSGRILTCALGRLRHNGPQAGRQHTVTFGYKIPVTTQALVLTAVVSGTGEPAANATDNTATLTAAVNYRSIAVVPGTKTAQHCTGTTLTAYFECTKYPSSIASHQAEYNGGGTISFTGEPSYSGTWTQADPTRLHVEYNNGSYVELIFDGRGTDSNCFEGISRFYEDSNPNDSMPPVLSQYLAAYRICI